MRQSLLSFVILVFPLLSISCMKKNDQYLTEDPYSPDTTLQGFQEEEQKSEFVFRLVNISSEIPQELIDEQSEFDRRAVALDGSDSFDGNEEVSEPVEGNEKSAGLALTAGPGGQAHLEFEMSDYGKDFDTKHPVVHVPPSDLPKYEVTFSKDGKVFVGGKPAAGGELIFVMDRNGKIYAGNQSIGSFHHSSFLGGNPVSAGGHMYVDSTSGKLTGFHNQTGHYRLPGAANNQLINELSLRNLDIQNLYVGEWVGGTTGIQYKHHPIKAGYYYPPLEIDKLAEQRTIRQVGLDGSVTTKTRDGTKTKVETDGTKVISAPDGTKTVISPDGTKTLTLPDGTKTVIATDGTKTTISLDGTRTIDTPDGTRSIFTPSGTKVVFSPDGTKSVYYTDGSQRIEYKSGLTESRFSDGLITRSWKDGTFQTIAKSGVVETKFPSGVVETKWANGAIETKIPGNPNRNIRFPDGEIMTIFPNNTKISELPNGTKITQHPNGWKRAVYASGDVEDISPRGFVTKMSKDGVVYKRFPSGVSEIKYPNGLKEITLANGTKVHKYESVSYSEKTMEKGYNDLDEGRTATTNYKRTVAYLDDVERLKYEVFITDDGRFVDYQGKNISTSLDDGIFVMDKDGRIFAGEHKTLQFHHSSFVSGASVGASGHIHIVDGRLIQIDNNSGHYKDPSSNRKVIKELRARGLNPSEVKVGVVTDFHTKPRSISYQRQMLGAGYRSDGTIDTNWRGKKFVPQFDPPKIHKVQVDFDAPKSKVSRGDLDVKLRSSGGCKVKSRFGKLACLFR